MNSQHKASEFSRIHKFNRLLRSFGLFVIPHEFDKIVAI